VNNNWFPKKKKLEFYLNKKDNFLGLRKLTPKRTLPKNKEFLGEKKKASNYKRGRTP
jgi:hypothetical protein